MESSLFEQMSMVKTIRFHSLREAFFIALPFRKAIDDID